MDIQTLCVIEPLSCWTLSSPISTNANTVGGDTPFLWMRLVVPPEPSGKLFGFAEFIQAFALLVLIYTVSGVRYQFRIATAPLKIWPMTFGVSAFIGVTALCTDLWFAQRFPLPAFLATQAYWQFALGLMFLAMALIWLWFAYVRPPIFSKNNSHSFTRAVYRYVSQGVEEDLPSIAAELERSAYSIVKFAFEYSRSPSLIRVTGKHSRKLTPSYARDLLLIIGNRRFSKYVALYAPNTAIAFFRAVAELKAYEIPMGQFAAALSTEALVNKDSLLYHEDAGFFSGYFGYVRPLTSSLYGNFPFIEALAANGNSPLDVDLDVRWDFDGPQLEAYCRAVLTTFKGALAEGEFYNNSYALNRAFGIVESGCRDMYKLDEKIDPKERSDIHSRVRAVIKFINDAMDAMEKNGVKRTILRRHDEPYKWHNEYYDRVAALIFEVVGHASTVKTREFEGWTLQFSEVWASLFGFRQNKTRKIVMFKVRRLIFEEVKSMEKWPNYKNARYLGFCLNVLGLKIGPSRNRTDYDYALRKAIIGWTQKNFLKVVQTYPTVADAAMLGTITFDPTSNQIVKTYRKGLNDVVPTDTLKLSVS